MSEIENEEGQGHFKMPLDDAIEEAPIPAGVNELRLEKINTRVTVISVIIPVLIVIILIFTYLDIKRRMEQTEDTGTMGVQKLSTDLESRFSSLSVRQARLEDETIRMAQNIEKSFVRLEVKLKELTDVMENVKASGASKKELKGKVSEVDNKIVNLAGSIEEVDAQLSTLSDGLKTDMEQLTQDLTANRTQLQSLEEKITALDKNKIEKPTLELALRLESLRIEQSLQAELETLRADLKNLDQKVRKLSQQTRNDVSTPSPIPPPPTEGKIEEQPLPGPQ